jgi:hypothetical protein
MQVAEILSDITSLRVCVSLSATVTSCSNVPHRSPGQRISAQGPDDNDSSIDTDISQGHNEALALVSGPISTDEPPAESGSVSNGQPSKQEALQRAKELVQLHYEVKSRHVDGEVDEELRQAREDVYRVLRELA